MRELSNEVRLRVVSAGMADHSQTACGGQLPPAGAFSST